MVYNNYTEQRLGLYAATHDDNNEYESSHMYIEYEVLEAIILPNTISYICTKTGTAQRLCHTNKCVILKN